MPLRVGERGTRRGPVGAAGRTSWVGGRRPRGGRSAHPPPTSPLGTRWRDGGRTNSGRNDQKCCFRWGELIPWSTSPPPLFSFQPGHSWPFAEVHLSKILLSPHRFSMFGVYRSSMGNCGLVKKKLNGGKGRSKDKSKDQGKATSRREKTTLEAVSNGELILIPDSLLHKSFPPNPRQKCPIIGIKRGSSWTIGCRDGSFDERRRRSGGWGKYLAEPSLWG